MKNKVAIKNALISCHDKTGLKYFAAELVKINPQIRIYCSSGTYNELGKAVDVKNLVEVSDYTGTKEMPSGLVKTLHPKVHSGILSDLDDEAMRKAKTGQFYLTDGHRSMANNSAVYVQKPSAAEFMDEWIALAK